MGSFSVLVKEKLSSSCSYVFQTIYYSSTKALCQVEKGHIPNVQCLFLSALYLQLMVFTTQCTYLIAHFFFSGPSASSNVSIPKNYVGTQKSGFLVSSGMAQCWLVLWILKEPLVPKPDLRLFHIFESHGYIPKLALWSFENQHLTVYVLRSGMAGVAAPHIKSFCWELCTHFHDYSLKPELALHKQNCQQ